MMGKKYEVPSRLTILKALEYAGYQLVRGCGCRSGVCGACAAVYRIRGKQGLHFCLACQTQVQDKMDLALLPYFPLSKKTYSLEKIKPESSILKQLYPEIDHCISCGACTRSCPQHLNVMQYIADARRGELKKCARESFGCVLCGICSSRCPAEISHPQVALLARRLTGKYLTPKSAPLEKRVQEIADGKFDKPLEELMNTSPEKLQRLYNSRDIEK